MYHIFINLSVDGHLGYLHVLAIVNSAAMNIRVHISFWIIIFCRYMPRGGSAKSLGILSNVRDSQGEVCWITFMKGRPLTLMDLTFLLVVVWKLLGSYIRHFVILTEHKLALWTLRWMLACKCKRVQEWDNWPSHYHHPDSWVPWQQHIIIYLWKEIIESRRKFNRCQKYSKVCCEQETQDSQWK